MSESGESGSAANFCGKCGAPIHGANFCPSCGTPSGLHAAVTPEMAAAAAGGQTQASGPPEPANGQTTLVTESGPFERPPGAPAIVTGTPAPGDPGRKRGPGLSILVGGLAVALIAAVVVVVFLLTSSNDSEQAAADADRAYQQQVAKAFGPVLGANQKVSESLNSLSGTQPVNARRAVREAQQATTQASGALRALEVPPGQEQLAAEAKQVLDREVAYLGAVSAVLGHPTVAGASQLQTLSSNLTSALTAAGPAVAGEEQTVDGADRLTSWARTTSRTLQRREAAKKARARARSGSGSSGLRHGTAAERRNRLRQWRVRRPEYLVLVRAQRPRRLQRSARIDGVRARLQPGHRPDLHDVVPAFGRRRHVLWRQQRVGDVLSPTSRTRRCSPPRARSRSRPAAAARTQPLPTAEVVARPVAPSPVAETATPEADATATATATRQGRRANAGGHDPVSRRPRELPTAGGLARRRVRPRGLRHRRPPGRRAPRRSPNRLAWSTAKVPIAMAVIDAGGESAHQNDLARPSPPPTTPPRPGCGRRSARPTPPPTRPTPRCGAPATSGPASNRANCCRRTPRSARPPGRCAIRRASPPAFRAPRPAPRSSG